MSDGEVIETSENGLFRVRLVQDEDAQNPREDAVDNGVMWCRHPDYTLGDEGTEEFVEVSHFVDEILEWLSGNAVTEAVAKHVRRKYGATVVLPLYLLDHSGLWMTAGPALPARSSRRDNPFGVDPGGWDTSYVGFIFDTDKNRAETGCSLDYMEQGLREEVETYSSYLEGDVYGYIVEQKVTEHITVRTPDGKILREEDHETWDEVESCWGFIGCDYATEEAKGALKEAMG